MNYDLAEKMLIGYIRVSKSDGWQTLDQKRDTLIPGYELMLKRASKSLNCHRYAQQVSASKKVKRYATGSTSWLKISHG